MFARLPQPKKPCHAGQVALEALENRQLLAVIDATSSSVGTIVYPLTAWRTSGVTDGFIAVGTYPSDNVTQFTDENGTHTSHSRADAYTTGNDAGWVLPWNNIGKMSTQATTDTQVTNGGAPAIAQTYGVLDYVISIRQTQPLPSGFPAAIINVPIITDFSVEASITGNPGASVESGNATAYVEVCLSDGSQFSRQQAEVNWPADQGKADAGGDAQDLKDGEFSNTLAYSPATHGSDYLSVTLNSSGSSMVAVEGNGTMHTYALANPDSVKFDQLTFENTYGANAFILADYFEFVLGFDPAIPVPGKSGGKTGQPLSTTCSTPDLTDLSDTGPSDTDNITGDLTPTFEGLAFSGTKPLKSGQVILYVDGSEAGRGVVAGGNWRVTTDSELSAGAHTITVSAGANDILMGPRSSPLTITIDTNLPRGDTTTVTLGDGGAKSVIFTDADGTTATLKLTAGSGDLTFTGEGLGLVEGKSALTVIGDGLELTGLDLTGMTSKAKLTVTTKGIRTGDKFIDIGNITADAGMASITAGGVDLLGDLNVDGAIGSLTLNSVPAGSHSIQVVSIGTFKVTGELSSAAITLSQPAVAGQPKVMALGTLTVGGAMDGSTIESAGHVGKVTLGQMLDSTLFAGVDTNSNALGILPDELTDFLPTAARLDSFTIAGIKGQTVNFQNSFVAAPVLGKISLMGLPSDNSAAGGVAGDSLLTSYTRKAGKTTAFTLKGPKTAAVTIETLDDYIARLV